MSSAPLAYDEQPMAPSYFAAPSRASRFGPSYCDALNAPLPRSFYPSQERAADGTIDDWPLPSTTDSSASFDSPSPVSEPAFFPSLPGPPHPATQSGPMASPPSLAIPTASASPPCQRRKKRRVRAVDREQRLERRRAQHRQVDAARRLKETEAMARLYRLVSGGQQVSVKGLKGEVDCGSQLDATGEADEKCRKVRRLNILEASVALIERLKAACDADEARSHSSHSRTHSDTATEQRATITEATIATAPFSFDHLAACGGYPPMSSPSPPPERISLHTTRSSSIHSASFPHLSIAPPSSPSYVACPDRPQALCRPGAASVSSSLCVLVVRPPGIIEDVNDRFLACTGWRRSDVVDTSVNVRDIVAGRRLSPLIFQQPHQRQLANDWADSDAHATLPVQPLSQYPALMNNIHALLRGDKLKAHGAWRCWMSDGRLFECNATFWGETDERPVKEEDWDSQGEERGADKPPPDRLVAVYSWDDVVVVDNEEDWQLRDC